MAMAEVARDDITVSAAAMPMKTMGQLPTRRSSWLVTVMPDHRLSWQTIDSSRSSCCEPGDQG